MNYVDEMIWNFRSTRLHFRQFLVIESVLEIFALYWPLNIVALSLLSTRAIFTYLFFVEIALAWLLGVVYLVALLFDVALDDVAILSLDQLRWDVVAEVFAVGFYEPCLFC